MGCLVLSLQCPLLPHFLPSSFARRGDDGSSPSRKADLQRGLARIQAIVERRNSMPILANVLLDAERRRRLTPHRGDGPRGRHPELARSQGLEVGRPHRLRPQALRHRARAPYEPVSLGPPRTRTSRSRAAGRASRSQARRPRSTRASPSPSDKLVRLPAAVLSVMIERTMYAASVDETRYKPERRVHRGRRNAGKLRWSPPRHRLALSTAPSDPRSRRSRRRIIPRKGLAETKRLVDERTPTTSRSASRG